MDGFYASSVSRVITRHGADDAGPLTESLVLSAPYAMAEMVCSPNRGRDPRVTVPIDCERNDGTCFLFGVVQRSQPRRGVPPE